MWGTFMSLSKSFKSSGGGVVGGLVSKKKVRVKGTYWWV